MKQGNDSPSECQRILLVVYYRHVLNEHKKANRNRNQTNTTSKYSTQNTFTIRNK